jgi:hypothetical protein
MQRRFDVLSADLWRLTFHHEPQRITHTLGYQTTLELFLRWQIAHPLSSLLRTARCETLVYLS